MYFKWKFGYILIHQVHYCTSFDNEMTFKKPSEMNSVGGVSIAPFFFLMPFA